MMANARPPDVLPLETLRELQLEAELAAASYSDGRLPEGFVDVDLKSIGLAAKNRDGVFFVNGEAAARLMERNGDWFLAFRGTDSRQDLVELITGDGNYVKEFALLLGAIEEHAPGRLHVTGHSLGAIAAHQLRADAADYGEIFTSADYFSFASPVFDAPNGVTSFGYANDAIYGLIAGSEPPLAREVYWCTAENGVEQAEATDPANNAPHAIANQAEGLARMIAADVLRPQFGLVEARGLDLSSPVILSGSHETVTIPHDFAGRVVVLGIDSRLAGEARAEMDRADVIVGRDAAAADWIDGMRGDDAIRAGAGDDRLIGGMGRDTLTGGKGDDILFGGAGRDALSGGKGGDRFVVTETQGRPDAILDFHAIAGTRSADQRDVIAIDADSFDVEDGAPVVIVNGRGRPEPAEAAPTILYARGNGQLFFDPDGTGAEGPSLIAVLIDGPGRLQIGDVLLV